MHDSAVPMLVPRRASQRKLPTAAFGHIFVDAGCLMYSGENLGDMSRRAATYVDKILKGERQVQRPCCLTT